MPQPEGTGALAIIDPARYGLPTKPVREVAHIADAIDIAARNGCNVLAPRTQISHIPPTYAVVMRVVTFDAVLKNGEKSNGTFYLTDEGMLALHRSALDQLSAAAGLSWNPAGCRRLDDRQTVYYWHYQMTGIYRAFDGTQRSITRDFELDLRDGAPSAEKALGREGKSFTNLRNQRIYGASLCQSKAANRVVRAAFGLRAYTREEAARPFVFPALVWLPPTDDPMINRMIAAKELGLVRDVFGPAGASEGPVLAEHGMVIEGKVEEAGKPRQITQGAPPVDYRAEADRLGNRERVPVHADNAERVAAGDPEWAGGTRRSAGPPPWEKAPGPPWFEFKLADLIDYCEAAGWPDPTKLPDERREKFLAHLRGEGKKDFDGFLAATDRQ